MNPQERQPFGVHSEVGQLRKVLVCAPGRAHQRLTPTNCDDLLFDDVMWVESAKRDHADFVTSMRERGIEVLEMHDLLAQTVALPEARAWILDHQIVANQVGIGLVDEVRSYLEGLPARELAETLIGGLSTDEFPETHGGDMIRLVREAAGVNEYLLPPLPNTLYTRDTTCWIYGGVTLNPLFWPARHEETVLATSIYRFHPDFAGRVRVWWGDPTQAWGMATLEGGDVMPIGNRTVLIGMSERSLTAGHQPGGGGRCSTRARRTGSSSPRCPSCARPCTSTRSSRSPTATACCSTPTSSTDRRLLLPPGGQPRGPRARPEAKPFVEVVAESLGLPALRVVETGRQRLRARAHAVGLRRQPGLRLAGGGVRLRPQHLHQRPAAQAGHRGRGDRGRRARPGTRRRALHDVPDHPGPCGGLGGAVSQAALTLLPLVVMFGLVAVLLVPLIWHFEQHCCSGARGPWAHESQAGSVCSSTLIHSSCPGRARSPSRRRRTRSASLTVQPWSAPTRKSSSR